MQACSASINYDALVAQIVAVATKIISDAGVPSLEFDPVLLEAGVRESLGISYGYFGIDPVIDDQVHTSAPITVQSDLPTPVTRAVPTGIVLEDYIFSLTSKLAIEFGLAGNVTRTSSQSHAGDVCYTSKGNKVLFECKEYSGTVPAKQYTKLRDDMQSQNATYGVLISRTSAVSISNGEPIRDSCKMIEMDNIWVAANVDEQRLKTLLLLVMALTETANADTSEHKYNLREFFALMPAVEEARKCAQKTDMILQKLCNDISARVLGGKKKLKKVASEVPGTARAKRQRTLDGGWV